MNFTKKYALQLAATTFLAFFLLLTSVVAQNIGIPAKPDPPRLVNDFVNFLTPAEQNQLEHKLVAIDDSTSTQIVILVLKSLNGNDINALGPDIIRNWGIGQKGKNNGMLIIVQPKTKDEDGHIAISTGYGLEGPVTDAIAKQIIDNVILPAFKNGKYYQGLDEAVNTLYTLSKGDFPANLNPKKKKSGKSNFPIGAIVVVIIILIAIFGNRSGGSQHMSSGGGLPFWLLMTSMMSGRGGGGGFGSFSDGGGEFGGFGGGDGGGGGASGSW